MIGEIRKVLMQYFDLKQGKMLMKSRPALVIAQADANDYVILPISRITRQENRDPVYDIKVDPCEYPQLHLNAVSFIRTHKQTTAHRSQMSDMIGDLKTDYPDLFLRVLDTREQFSEEITNQALQ